MTQALTVEWQAGRLLDPSREIKKELKMNIYRVAGRIDRGEATYFPEDPKSPEHGSKIQSAGNGKIVRVDSTGFIELGEEEAEVLLQIGVIKPLDLEIAALEKKRDEALTTAKEAQDELERRRSLLERVIKARKKAGVAAGAEQTAVEKSKQNETELVGAGKK
jgi:hypothetical protein